jgi:transketolase
MASESKSSSVLGMRDAYFEALYDVFCADPNAVFITADNGAPSLDQFAIDFPDRYFNVGIAEQQLIGMAAGLAFEGKKVYTYAIAPFVSLRCFEQNKLDMCAMNLPIVNIGVGAGYAYDVMGPSHHTVEDVSVMRVLPNLVIYSPSDGVSAGALVETVHADPRPQYLRFDRSGLAGIHDSETFNPELGQEVLRKGTDVCIVATGVMVHTALEAAERLASSGLSVGVIDLYRLKPISGESLLASLASYEHVVTMEEHLLAGGMGGAIAEIFADFGATQRLLRIGQDDRFVFDYGGREAIWEKYGLDADSITTRIAEWSAASSVSISGPVAASLT